MACVLMSALKKTRLLNTHHLSSSGCFAVVFFLCFSDNDLHFCPLQTLRMAVGPAPSTASSLHSNTAAAAAASLQTGARQMLIRELSERERRMIYAATH